MQKRNYNAAALRAFNARNLAALRMHDTKETEKTATQHREETVASTASRTEILEQQNSEFWTTIKLLKKAIAERDEQISHLKSDLQKTTLRAENAERSLETAKSTLQKVQSDNETLKATLTANGNSDPLQWKKQYEEVEKRYSDLRWDNWVDHCRARGRDPYD